VMRPILAVGLLLTVQPTNDHERAIALRGWFCGYLKGGIDDGRETDLTRSQYSKNNCPALQKEIGAN
jgi:hypothetical protein